jgi:hypothetical protein
VFVSRQRYDELVAAAALAGERGIRNHALEAEVKRLTDIIIEMRQRGFAKTARADDPDWGRYTFDEVETETHVPDGPVFSDGAEEMDPELEAMARAEIARVFPGLASSRLGAE